MLAVLDVESSGLGPSSFPISVAWRFLRTGEEGHVLIRPSAQWRGWQDEAERIHGLSREQAERDGVSAPEAASRIETALAGAEVFSDAPSLDQRWLDLLFAEAPGCRAPALRRFGELFPGADRAAVALALSRVGPQQAEFKATADARRLALAAELWLAGLANSQRQG